MQVPARGTLPLTAASAARAAGSGTAEPQDPLPARPASAAPQPAESSREHVLDLCRRRPFPAALARPAPSPEADSGEDAEPPSGSTRCRWGAVRSLTLLSANWQAGKPPAQSLRRAARPYRARNGEDMTSLRGSTRWQRRRRWAGYKRAASGSRTTLGGERRIGLHRPTTASAVGVTRNARLWPVASSTAASARGTDRIAGFPDWTTPWPREPSAQHDRQRLVSVVRTRPRSSLDGLLQRISAYLRGIGSTELPISSIRRLVVATAISSGGSFGVRAGYGYRRSTTATGQSADHEPLSSMWAPMAATAVSTR